jgi:hypothetical protein
LTRVQQDDDPVARVRPRADGDDEVGVQASVQIADRNCAGLAAAAEACGNFRRRAEAAVTASAEELYARGGYAADDCEGRT